MKKVFWMCLSGLLIFNSMSTACLYETEAEWMAEEVEMPAPSADEFVDIPALERFFGTFVDENRSDGFRFVQYENGSLSFSEFLIFSNDGVHEEGGTHAWNLLEVTDYDMQGSRLILDLDNNGDTYQIVLEKTAPNVVELTSKGPYVSGTQTYYRIVLTDVLSDAVYMEKEPGMQTANFQMASALLEVDLQKMMPAVRSAFACPYYFFTENVSGNILQDLKKDPEKFWFYIMNYAYFDQEDTDFPICYTEKEIQEIVYALADGFDGNLPEPAGPVYKNEDGYHFLCSNPESVKIELLEYAPHEDGTLNARYSYTDELENTGGEFAVYLKTSPEQGGSEGLRYTIAAMTKQMDDWENFNGIIEIIEPEHSEASEPGEFVFADSSERYLTEEDLKELSKEQLRIARNEIYARRGRIFSSQDLREYFEAQPWYEGTIPGDAFEEHKYLNEIEYHNIYLIQDYEKGRS